MSENYIPLNKQNKCGLCCTKIKNFGVTIGKTQILHDVNMHIHCGELTAIIGPNGAGKSTLLKAVLGEIPHTGELSYTDHKNCRTGSPLIGYVPQYLNFDLSTPTSVFDFFMSAKVRKPSCFFHPKALRKEILESLKSVHADQLIDRRLGALSGGELQRVLLALALDPIPDILLLDEPVSGIDQAGLSMFYDTLSEVRKNYDLSIILVSHDLDLVFKFADRVVLLNRTVICSGKPLEVFRSPETREIFGLNWYNEALKSMENSLEGGSR